MSHVTIHHDKSQKSELAPASPMPIWSNPYRLWQDIIRWDPFAQMLPSPRGDEPALFAPDFDVKETKDGFVFKADLPGVQIGDLDIHVSENRLTVAGKRQVEKEEKTETTYRCERSFGSFNRSFTLPSGVDSDKVDAQLKDGVLTLQIAKRPETKGKQVNVKNG